MTVEIKVPVLPESVADATVAQWYKKPGDAIKRGENLVDLETDKVMLEVPAPQDGVLQDILKKEGSNVCTDEVVGTIAEGAVAEPAEDKQPKETTSSQAEPAVSPAVRRLMAEHNLQTSDVKGSGKDGRITKEDVMQVVEGAKAPVETAKPQTVVTAPIGERTEERVPMTRLRQRIAERLLEAQHNTAMLTTFNEINMKPVMDLRKRYKDEFEKAHGVRLGFMSFFVKAAVEALKRFPAVNASIDGQDIVYHGYFDIGIAVSTPKGLVVPVLRDADKLSMAEIEQQIMEYANKAKEGKLTIEEMTGGCFTITNGGVFGSLLSTPILNPPQSAILGMHKIEERVVVENGEMVIRPMMYLAMSYDHRIIDGRESVTFLVTIKECLEDPARLLLAL